jgi:hypothetical protein
MLNYYDITIEIADITRGKIFSYSIVAFIHSHPIDSGYDYNNPSNGDKNEASSWPASIKHYIINNDKYIEFNQNGLISRVNRPCK